MGGLQTQSGGYLARQPHFSQPTSQQIYGQQQVNITFIMLVICKLLNNMNT